MEDMTGSGVPGKYNFPPGEPTNSGYPSYNPYTTTSERPWLRPLLTTPGPPVASGQYQCRGEEDCHEMASCVYQQQTRRYRCQCDKWYEGDGWETCTPGYHHYICDLAS